MTRPTVFQHLATTAPRAVTRDVVRTTVRTVTVHRNQAGRGSTMLVSRGRVSGRPSFPEAGAAVSLIRSLHTALRRARGRRRHAVVAAGLALLMVTLSTLT